MASTGKTHGIKFSISPPPRAARKMKIMYPGPAGAAGGPGVAEMLNAWMRPSSPVSLNTPSSGLWGSNDGPRPRRSAYPPVVGIETWEPRLSVCPSSDGKNCALATLPGRLAPSRFSVPSGAILARNEDALGDCSAVFAKIAASTDGSGVPSGMESVKSPSSGTQMSRQTKPRCVRLQEQRSGG